MTLSTETAILSHLLTNENYTRKVLPFLKNEYFENGENKIIFDEFYKFMDEYNAIPSKEALHIEIEKRSDLNEEAWKNTQKVLNTLAVEETDEGWSFTIPEILDGRIEHEAGKERGEVVKVSNLKYWVAPEIIVCKGSKRSRIRDHGRNWDFTGGSAEYCAVDWAGP